jgi:hypothetical protein
MPPPNLSRRRTKIEGNQSMHHVQNTVWLLMLACASALAQSPGPEVKKFIAYDDAVIALAHVRVIDGTGAPAQDDRTLVVRNG